MAEDEVEFSGAGACLNFGRMRHITRGMLWMHLGALNAAAQLEIGQTEWTFVDESRGGRVIPCAVWYPAQTGGEDAEPAVGSWPAVVFGHGFVMSPYDYEGLAADLVAEGFVFAALGTEQGFAPSHADYGLDLAFVANAIASDVIAGVLETSLSARVAIGGHSMGGGATWLAAADNAAIDAVVALAPAQTSPSATASGPAISAPVLVVSGSADAVTPPSSQHVPIYESASNAPCRALVSIEGGGHCGFADVGTLCDFGELGFAGLSHAEQRALTTAVLAPWLNAFLNDAPDALDELDAVVAAESLLTMDMACALDVHDVQPLEWTVFPNPASGAGWVKNQSEQEITVGFVNLMGQPIQATRSLPAGASIQVQLPAGAYVVRGCLSSGECQSTRWFIH